MGPTTNDPATGAARYGLFDHAFTVAGRMHDSIASDDDPNVVKTSRGPRGGVGKQQITGRGGGRVGQECRDSLRT